MAEQTKPRGIVSGEPTRDELTTALTLLDAKLQILRVRHSIAMQLLTATYGAIALKFPGSALADTLRDFLGNEVAHG